MQLYEDMKVKLILHTYISHRTYRCGNRISISHCISQMRATSTLPLFIGNQCEALQYIWYLHMCKLKFIIIVNVMSNNSICDSYLEKTNAEVKIAPKPEWTCIHTVHLCVCTLPIWCLCFPYDFFFLTS